MSQSCSVPPASFSLALKSPLTAVACGEEKDIFLPREEGEEMVVGGEAAGGAKAKQRRREEGGGGGVGIWCKLCN